MRTLQKSMDLLTAYVCYAASAVAILYSSAKIKGDEARRNRPILYCGSSSSKSRKVFSCVETGERQLV